MNAQNYIPEKLLQHPFPEWVAQHPRILEIAKDLFSDYIAETVSVMSWDQVIEAMNNRPVHAFLLDHFLFREPVGDARAVMNTAIGLACAVWADEQEANRQLYGYQEAHSYVEAA